MLNPENLTYDYMLMIISDLSGAEIEIRDPILRYRLTFLLKYPKTTDLVKKKKGGGVDFRTDENRINRSWKAMDGPRLDFFFLKNLHDYLN